MYRDERRGDGYWDRGGERRYSGGRGRPRDPGRYQPDGEEGRFDGYGRGYRGNRGGGRGGYRGSDQNYRRNEERDRDETSGQRGGRGKHPPGLKGREIGLWYARNGKARAERQEKEQRPEIKMVKHQEQKIRKLLYDIKSSRDCPPQPSRSGAELPPESDETDWFEEDKTSDQHPDTACREAGEQPTACGTMPSATGTWPESDVIEIEDDIVEFDAMPKTAGAEPTTDVIEIEDDIEELGTTPRTAGAEPESDVIEIEDDIVELPAITELMQVKVEEDYLSKEENEVTLELPESSDIDAELLDLDLFYEYQQKQKDYSYQDMRTFRQKLPSYADRQKIIDTIHSNQVVVLSGETGCGKTTQVPQYILDDYIERRKGSRCRILCTQPRRISAISVAERVAAERAEKCGDSVGYMIRLENKLPRNEGSILYCTTGILLKVLESDPLLHKATHIILDEIHERDLLSDFLIIILRDILPRRPDLKLVLMSATLNAEAFSQYFYNCPMINVPGFTFPVEEYVLEDVIELLRYKLPEKMMRRQPRRGKQWKEAEEEQQHRDVWLRNMESNNRYSHNTLDTLWYMDMSKIDLELVRDLIKYIVTHKGDGAILVFLPGWADISDLHKMLTGDRFFSSSAYRLIPLHSMMPTMNQREVFEKPPSGVRKIVIATNIAETSITIDDVVFVIDGGRIKVKGFTPENNLATLDAEIVSRANSRQRRGRAGRVQPGECYHLYTSLQESMMLDYLPPEILRTRLEELCLQIKYLKLGEIVPFVKKAMQPPALAAVQAAIVNLQNLNALDSDENLLPLGKHLARMPLDPHTGKMILFGAMFGCLDPILTIAASLDFKDPFYIPLGKESLADKARMELSKGSCSDHLLLVRAFERWEKAKRRGTSRQLCYDYFMSESTLTMLQKMRRQLAEVLQELGFIKSRSTSHEAANRNSDNLALVKAIVCAGLYPNVARIKKFPTRHRPMTFLTRTDGKVDLHPKSVAKEIQDASSNWVVFHKKMKTTQVWIYDCSLVSPYSLLFFGGGIRQIKEDNVDTVCVDGWIKFKASPDTVGLVKELRRELDYVLDSKITHSRETHWDPRSKEEAVIKAIIDLVTTEDASSNIESRRR